GLAPRDPGGGAIEGYAIARDMLAVRFHFELLHVGGQLAQALGVWDERIRSPAARLAVPHLDQGGDGRDIVRKRGVAEMVVHVCGPGEEPVEDAVLEGDDAGETDAGPQRITSPDPIPEFEDVILRRPPRLRLLRRSRGGRDL